MSTVRTVVHPGWIAVSGPEVDAVVAVADRHAPTLEDAARGGLLALLEALTAHGLSAAPDLVACAPTPTGLRVVVRGAGVAVLPDGTRVGSDGRMPWADLDVDVGEDDEMVLEAPEPKSRRGWRRPARLARSTDERAHIDQLVTPGTPERAPIDQLVTPGTSEPEPDLALPPPDEAPPAPSPTELLPVPDPDADPVADAAGTLVVPGPTEVMPPASGHGTPDVTTHRGVQPRSDDDLDRPVVLAVLCPAGHPSPPHAGTCRTCGRGIPPQQPLPTPRPSLGVLRISTGGSVPLDRGVLLGRAPRVNEELPANQRPHLVRVGGADRDISRNHAEVVLEGWHVLVRDLGSTNGTTVTLPGQEPVRLRPTEDQGIEPGTVVTLADEVELTYEVQE